MHSWVKQSQTIEFVFHTIIYYLPFQLFDYNENPNINKIQTLIKLFNYHRCNYE